MTKKQIKDYIKNNFQDYIDIVLNNADYDSLIELYNSIFQVIELKKNGNI